MNLPLRCRTPTTKALLYTRTNYQKIGLVTISCFIAEQQQGAQYLQKYHLQPDISSMSISFPRIFTKFFRFSQIFPPFFRCSPHFPRFFPGSIRFWRRCRVGTVAVGPPYQLREKMDAMSPAWSALRVLDLSIEKADWVRSYSNLVGADGVDRNS